MNVLLETPSCTTTKPLVLVVEDDADTRLGVEVALSAAGFEVLPLGEGRPTASVVQTLAPEVIVLDLGLPDTAGLEILRQLRRCAPGARTIVMSGRVGPDYERAALDAGALRYLGKPVTGDRLVAAIRDILATD